MRTFTALSFISILMMVALSPVPAHAVLYDFESDTLPASFVVNNQFNYSGLIGTTASLLHDGQKSLEISSPESTPGGKGVTIPLSGNNIHISWWQYDAYGSNGPIYMKVLLETVSSAFHIELLDSGWGGVNSGSVTYYTDSGVSGYGPSRVAGSWTKIDLYYDNNSLRFWANNTLVDTVPLSGNLNKIMFYITGWSGGGYWIDSLLIEESQQTLNLGLTGSGNGYVSISPLNTAINTSTSTAISTGTQIKLHANPTEFSTFTGWTGDCVGTADCTLTMNADKTVYAIFNDAPNPIRINLPKTSDYSKFSDAYFASASGASIKAWGTSFAENLLFNQDKKISVVGGCNTAYSICSGLTTINGTMTIQNGSVEVSNLVIQGSAVNHVPVANAGANQKVTTGDKVVLNGSISSDADNDLLTYQWSIVSKPAGSTSILSTTNIVNPSITVDSPGDYIIRLIVSDGKANSTESLVTISASLPNIAPVANAGTAQNAITGKVVTLDGSGSSDANGDLLTYTWIIVSAPPGSTATLSSINSASTQFIPDLKGTYVFGLIVNDGKLNSPQSTVTITTVDSVEIYYNLFQNGLNMSPCNVSGNITISQFTWLFSDCRVYGNAGNKLSFYIKNNSSDTYTLNSLKLSFPLTITRSYSISAGSNILSPYNTMQFDIPMATSSEVTNGTAVFDIVEIGNVTGSFEMK